MLEQLRRLPTTVWLIGLISLLNDSASEMIYPLVPLYLASVLMAGPKALGLIEGVAEATSSLMKLLSGVVMDRTGKSKALIVVGYTLAGVSRPLLALTTGWPGVLAIRFADRLGKGFRSSPRDALLAASVTPSQRGLAFGFHRALDNAGAVIGPLLAGALLSAGYGYRQIFQAAVVPAILCFVLALCLPEMAQSSPQAPKSPESGGPLPPVFWRYLVSLGLFTLGNSSNMFLLLRARELGLPPGQVPFLWGTVSLIAMLFSTPFSALSDRWGRKRLILGGWLAYAAFYLALGCLPGGVGPGLYALFAFYGLFLAATEGVEKALIADIAPKALLGTAYGWFHFVTGATLLPASLLFGWIYERSGPTAAFACSATCAALAALLLIVWVGLPRGRSAEAGHTEKLSRHPSEQGDRL